MDVKQVMKEWRIWVLVASLLISTLLLFPFNPLPYDIDDNGDVSLDHNINLGLDLKGGTQVLLSAEGENVTQEEIQQIQTILEKRVSAFGLEEATVRTVRIGDQLNIQMDVATTDQESLRGLIKQEGTFEARLPITVTDTLKYSLGEEHNFEYVNNSLRANGKDYSPGEDFELEGTKFYYINNSENGAELEVVAYDGEDVQQVLTADGRVQPQGDSYNFRFPVVISSESARNVKQTTSNYPSGAEYIQRINGAGNAELMLYVDGVQESSLAMSTVFKRQTITQPSINGGAATAEEARNNMKELQAVLQSGSLPRPVQIESLNQITSSLGDEFLSAAVISIIAALLAVGILVFLRYWNPKIVLPIVITGASEVYILMGAFFSTFITLNLSAIAGIIAAVGTGVDDQIIITDESDREKIVGWKERLKRAFFIIFTSAASTIGAMTPLINPSVSAIAVGAAGLGLIGYNIVTRHSKPHYVGIGIFAVIVSAVSLQLNPSAAALQSIKGFAITTIIGVLVGITITRPAYAKVLEFIEDK